MERQLISSNYQLFKTAVVQLFRLNSTEVAGMKAIVFPATRGFFVFRLLLFVMILPLTAAIFFLPFVFCLLYFVFYLLPLTFKSLTFNLYPLAFSQPSALKNATRTPRHQVAQGIKYQQYIISAPIRFFNLLAKKGLSFLSFLFYLLSFVFCLLSFYLLSLTF
jgi:hypothetical protein